MTVDDGYDGSKKTVIKNRHRRYPLFFKGSEKLMTV
jgi:hypothetical protein